ncbi:Transcriptional regulator WhiB1 [Streptomyces sp. MH192]|nr:Transcriptional regulator WhiB1 [Streptomyces sp. MH192]MCF0098804.1 Transcriptional regulator WhiB1 [Streptomyces sp. MH191]
MTARTRRLTTRAALTLTIEDPLNSTAWRDNAVCRTVDPELFFPHSTVTEQGRRQTETAKRVCQNCLVRRECLAWALETRQDVGVWGGASEDERRKMHRRLPLYQKARKTKAVDHILSEQRGEFLACVERGLTPMQIAKELGTNVQTVKSVKERLEQETAPAGTSTVAVAV